MSDDRYRQRKSDEGTWKLEAGSRQLESDYDSPAARVWLPSRSAWSRAAAPIDSMEVRELYNFARCAITLAHADRNAGPRAHVCPVREPQLPRVVGLLHR